MPMTAVFHGDEAVEARRTKRLTEWAELFTEHVYMVLNRVNPGMKMESDAVQYISKILILVLHEFVEQAPDSIPAVQGVIKKLFPSAWASFVVKHTDFKDFEKSWNRRKDHKSKEAKSVAFMIKQISGIMNKHTDKAIEERVINYIYSILDEITNDILRWTAISITKFQADRSEIDKRVLVAAMFTDRGLSELMERLLPGAENDYCAIDFHQVPQTASEKQQIYDYDKICNIFRSDEESFLSELAILVDVFKRRLEKGIGDDLTGQQYIHSVFGNITDIYELTFRIMRAIEEVREMSQSQCMGTGLAEFAEGQEFDSYIRFMEIFKEPVEDKVNALLRDPRYTRFFNEEDRISFTSNGQFMRTVYKYVLPHYLHAVASHFKQYHQYVTLLIKASRPGLDRTDLQNLESHLKSVSVAIKSLNLPPNRYKPTSQLRDEVLRGQSLSQIQRIQRSIEGWEGRVIGFVCHEFICEGNLNVLHQNPSVKGTIRGKLWSLRRVFLFDQLLVITKPIKNGSTFKYKQQIRIQSCDIFDLPDEDDLKFAFRVRVDNQQNPKENTDIILFCQSAEEKVDWLTSMVTAQSENTLRRMLESYNRETESKAPLVLPSPEAYPFAEPDTDDNIIFEDYMRSSGSPVVKNGTLVKLVERLTYPAYSDIDYIKTFLTTYRTFCTPNELFTLLVMRFNIPLPAVFSGFENVQSPPPMSKSGGPLAGRYDTVQSHGLSNNTHLEQAFMRFRKDYQKRVQVRVLNAFYHWINHHFYDFAHNPELLTKLKDFLTGNDGRTRLTNDHHKTCKKLLDNIARREQEVCEENTNVVLNVIREQCMTADGEMLNGKKKTGRTLVGTFPDVLWHHAKKGEIENYNLLTLHPVEVGRQVTLLEFNLYSAVKAVELVGAVFYKKDEQKSPQLKKITHHSNMLSYWISRCIVETECIEERVEIISRVLEIMVVLEQLNNFAGIVAFGSALTLAAVDRLKESRCRLDKEKQQYYEHFRRNIFADAHQKYIRERMRSVNPPCIPFFGSFMSRIYFSEQQNSTFVDKKNENEEVDRIRSRRLISFVKCRKTAEIIKEVQLYQSQPYLLRAEPSILQFFENLNPLNGFENMDDFEAYLHEQSHKIEPRESDKLFQGKPKYPPEALKSPGIKVPSTVKTPSTPRTGSLRSPKSPSALTFAAATPSPDDSHLGIVDIIPGQQPRYIGDAPGRINQAFLEDTPLHTPTGINARGTPSTASRRKLTSPLSGSEGENHFRFPPQNPHFSPTPPSTGASVYPTTMAPGAIVLNKPPVGKKPMALGGTGSLHRRKAPPPPPPVCEASSSKAFLDPPRPGRSPNADLTENFALSSSSSPPKSPSVSLSVPLPKEEASPSSVSADHPETDAEVGLANRPPRPPKPVRLQAAPAPTPLPTEAKVDKSPPAPPLPPKTYRRSVPSP